MTLEGEKYRQWRRGMARDNARLEAKRREAWGDDGRKPNFGTTPSGEPLGRGKEFFGQQFQLYGVANKKAHGENRAERQKTKATEARLIQRLVFAQKFVCALCDKPFGHDKSLRPTIDHKIPKSKGGTNAPSNLQATHAICNELKGDAILPERKD